MSTFLPLLQISRHGKLIGIMFYYLDILFGLINCCHSLDILFGLINCCHSNE